MKSKRLYEYVYRPFSIFFFSKRQYIMKESKISKNYLGFPNTVKKFIYISFGEYSVEILEMESLSLKNKWKTMKT